jgi:hypothetical protein
MKKTRLAILGKTLAILASALAGAFISGCASAPVIRTPLTLVQPHERLRQIPIGIVAAFPLPPTYPSPSEPNEFSEEVFDLPTSEHLLIPTDHATMVNETLRLALKYAGLQPTLYPTIAHAAQAGSRFIIIPAIARVEVKVFTPGPTLLDILSRSYIPRPRITALTALSIAVFDARTASIRLIETLQWSLERPGLAPRRLTSSALWAPTLMNESTYQPLRALVAQGIFDLAQQLIDRLNGFVDL